MFNRRILKFSTTLITLLAILSHHNVKATGELPALPFCGNALNSNSPESGAAACLDESGNPIDNGKYCINKDKTVIFKSTSGVSNSCSKDPATLEADKYYVYLCVATSCEYKNDEAVSSLTEGSFVIYKYESSQLKQIKNDETVIVGGKLFICPKGDTSTFGDNGRCGLASNGIHINPKNDGTITSALVTVTSGTATERTPVVGSFYLDQSSEDSSDSSKFHKLIKCSSTTECVSDTPVKGVYIDETSQSNSYNKLITCDDNTCSSAVVNANAIKYYLNLGVTNSLEKAIVKCIDANTCSRENGVSGGYYLNSGSDSSSEHLIKCDATKCFTTHYSYTPTKTSAAFLDGGSYAGNKFGNIIKCIEETGCSNPSPALTAGAENFYYFINGDSASIDDAIITCTGVTLECSAGKGLAEGFYVDSVDDQHIINCDSSSCVSTPGSKLQGHAYIKAVASGKKDNIITYDVSNKFVATAKTSSIDADDNNLYYIDGSNPKKLISCIGATSGGGECSSDDPDLDGNKYLFHLDSTDTNGDHIIVCSSDGCVSSKGLQYCDESTCTGADGDPISATEYCISTDGKIYLSAEAGGDRRKRAGVTCGAQTSDDFKNSYVLMKDDNKKLALGASDAGYLYKCDGNSICEQVTEPGFFDDTNDILRINDGENSFALKTTTTENSYYLIKANELILCGSTTVASCATTAKTAGFYLNAAATTTTNAIIECNGSTCALRDAATGDYYVNNGVNKDAATKLPLITCPSTCGEKQVQAADEGTHLDSGNPSKLIVCTAAADGLSYTCENPTANEGSYIISATENTNIIHCKTVGGKINCSSDTHDGTATEPLYYLKGDSTITKLIKCINTGCTVVDKPFKGYYISKVDGNPAVLSCNGTTCKAETSIATTCSKVGEVVLYPDNDDPSKFIFALCTSNGSLEKEIMKKNGSYDSFYETLTLANASDFPGTSSQKTITVKAAEGRVFLLEDAKLPECGANCQGTADGKYCTSTEGANLKIKVRSDANCGTLTLATVFGTINEAGGDYPAYFKDDYDTDNTAAAATMSYICHFSSSTVLDNCKLVKGFSKDTIYCSGWKGDTCGTVTSATECTHALDAIGIIGSTNKVCFTSDDTDVSLSAKGNVVFYTQKPNIYYGIAAFQYVYLSLTASTALVSNEKDFLSQNVGYQINRSQIDGTYNALLSCTASTCVAQNAKEGYYLNNDNLNKSDKQLIKCTSTGCTLEASATKAYYIDAVNPSKIIYCETTSTCQSISHDATTYAPKHYLAKEADQQVVITCTPNGCFQENENLHGYFINGAGTTGKKLIKCEGSSSKCSLVADTDSYGSTVGKLKVVEGKVTMCVAVGCSGSGEVAIETSNAAPLYQTVKLASATDFPQGGSEKEISIRIANDGSVILLEDNLTTARKNNVETILPQTSNVEGQKVYLFGFEGDGVREGNTSFPNLLDDLVAYQCTYATSDNLNGDGTPAITQQRCARVKGYATLQDGSTIQCNGWIRDDCHLVSPKACAAGDEGKLGTGRKICFGESNTVLLPPSSQKTPNYMTFVQEGINSYYGRVKSDGLTYLELTPTSAIAIDPPVTEDGAVVAQDSFILQIGTEYKLYKYDKTIHIYALNKAMNDVYGFKQIGSSNTYIYYEALTNDASTVLFDCYNGICKKTQGYILVGTSIYSNVGSDTWVDKTSDTTIVTEETASSGTVGKLKKADLTIGYKTKASTDTYGYGNKDNKYFFGTDTDLKLYKLGVGIVAIPKPDDGYYFIKNNLVIDETGDLGEASTVEAKMVECSNGKCKVITPAAGYYANPIGVKLIKCTDSTITNCSFDNTAGYYIDNKNSLFFCDGTSQECEIKDEVGYFVNAGDTTTNKYIECTKTKCQAKPAPEASVTCTEGNIGKLVMDDEVVKVCLANGIMVSFSDSGSYMVAYQTGSAYKGYVTKISYSGMLSVSASAIKLNLENSSSNYCVSKTTMAATAKSSSPCDNETETEVMCNVDGVCLKADTTAETLPDSLRNVKVEEVSDEEESSSAADVKIECSVRDGSNCEETYYLIDKQNNYSVLEDGVGTLYQCIRNKNDQMTCTENFSIGYFIVDSTRGYYCREEASAINCSLLGDRIKTTATTCSAVGDIIFNSSNNKFFFCQKSSGATTEAIELNSNNSGNYAIPKSTDLDIFGLADSQYALITITDKIITFNNTYKNNLLYVYVNESQAGKNKLIEKGDTCPKTTGSSPTWDSESIVELDCKNGKCDVAAPPYS